MSEIKITSLNFENEVLNSEKPVLIDFWATWCGPCRMLEPIIEEISDEYEGIAVIGKVNVDEEPELASEFQISSIPTLVLIKNGKIINTNVGYISKKSVIDFLTNEQ